MKKSYCRQQQGKNRQLEITFCEVILIGWKFIEKHYVEMYRQAIAWLLKQSFSFHFLLRLPEMN